MVSRATDRGNCRWVPAARAMVLTPRNVAPNSSAETKAAVTPPISAGRAMPTAWMTRAAHNRSGRTSASTSQAHSAEDGTAARPTSTQAPLPAQPGELCSIAATRNVPADDVADALQGVGGEQGGEPAVRARTRSMGGPRRGADAGRGRALGTQIPRNSGEDGGESGRRPPGGPPVGHGAQDENEQTGQSDPCADSTECPAGQVSGVISQVAED